MTSISIDLTKYEVETHQQHISVLDCSGSILSMLNTDASVTNNRFSEDRKFAEFCDGWWEISYESDNQSCDFSPCGRDIVPDDMDRIVNWISNNYGAIESIEYEVLLKDPDLLH